MKRYAKIKKIPQYPNGGGISSNQFSGALSGAGTGFGVGNMIVPGVGGLVGAGVGAVGGLVSGYFQDKKQEELEAEQQELLKQQEIEQARLAEEARIRDQKAYTTAYNVVNPITGRSGAGIYAKGGRMVVPYSMKALGGDLVPLASDTTKAVGDTHQQDTNGDGNTGIILQNKGIPLAEVEDQEVMSGGNVFSDRLKVAPGVTFAKRAEQLGRKKGKAEELASSNNYRENNGGNRMLAKIDSDLTSLFELQEMNKKNQPVSNVPKAANGMNLYKPSKGTLTPEEITEEEQYAKDTQYNGTPGSYERMDWAKLVQKGVPYIDNLFNQKIINDTPAIPIPTNRVSYDLKPVTLKTNYNINPALNDAERNYQMLQKDFNENTSNSVTARGNKLAGFVNVLNNKSRLYNTKENIETDLINRNSMNVQSVTDRNTSNRQNVDNQNIGLKDTYNWAKMQRTSDMNKMKTANVANMVDNAATQIQDKNMETLDQQRIMTDALKYNDAAGFAKSIGSPTMTSIIRSNPQYYSQIEKALRDAGQNAALEEFYKMYGKPNP